MSAKYMESENNQATLFECLLSVAATATTALIFSLLTGLKWQGSLMVMASVALLIGGIVYSLLEMRRLGYPAIHHDPSRFNQPERLRIPHRQTAWQHSAAVDEACFHHENHPESAGEDQGQLLSHLSGSTPFLERLD